MAHSEKRAASWVARVVGLAVGCSPAIDVHTIRSPSAHFEQYHTVAFDLNPQAPSEYSLSPRSAEVRARVEQLAATTLQGRGYSLAPADHADLVVRIEAGRREQRVPMSNGTMPLGGGVAGLPMTSSGGNIPGPAAIETTYHGELDQEERDLVEGAFVIDAFDGRTRELVWHGSARTEINFGPVDYDRLRRAVEAVLAPFPARTGP